MRPDCPDGGERSDYSRGLRQAGTAARRPRLVREGRSQGLSWCPLAREAEPASDSSVRREGWLPGSRDGEQQVARTALPGLAKKSPGLGTEAEGLQFE